MSMRAYYLSAEGDLKTDLDEQQIREAYQSKAGLLWVEISEITKQDGDFIEQVFNFHHLAVEDCVSPYIHAPKVDEFEDYLFIIVHGINHATETEIVETAELGIFLGSHFVVSAHNIPLYSVEGVRQLVERDGRPMRRGAQFLVHALIDTLIDNVMPTIDIMSDVAEEIEEEVVHNPRQVTLEAIMKLKRSTLRIHRVMAPQRELLNRLSRGQFNLVEGEVQIFFRDVYDHLVRIEDMNQIVRDRTDNALSTYLSSVANRQNETMRVLSIVATIFLPLTLIAGIYGMNFEYMPELTWKWSYFVVLGVMVIGILTIIWRFWARGWLAWGRGKVSRARKLAVDPERLIGYLGQAISITRQHRH